MDYTSSRLTYASHILVFPNVLAAPPPDPSSFSAACEARHYADYGFVAFAMSVGWTTWIPGYRVKSRPLKVRRLVTPKSLFVIRSIKAFPADRVVRKRLPAAIGKVFHPILEGLCPLHRGHSRFHGLHRHVLFQKALHVLTDREPVFLRARLQLGLHLGFELDFYAHVIAPAGSIFFTPYALRIRENLAGGKFRSVCRSGEGIHPDFVGTPRERVPDTLLPLTPFSLSPFSL